MGNSGNELRALKALSVIDTALKDAASMSMCANHHTVLANGVVDELRALSPKAGKTFLDNVVAIKVLDKINDTGRQCLDDSVDLFRSVHKLDHLLQ
jgi:hypothetical protein